MSSAHLNKFTTVSPAVVEWRDGLPFSPEFDDVYFSSQGAIEETNHVFIAGNHLVEDWQSKKQNKFTLVELGFGTGLNFLVAASHWQKCLQSASEPTVDKLTNQGNQEKTLQYISIEKHPLRLEDLRKAQSCWPENEAIAIQLQSHYPSPSYGRFQIDFAELNISLLLLFMPVEEALLELQNESESRTPCLTVDHWFLDGFAPAKNKSMWQNDLFKRIASLSHIGTRLATFSVASAVKTPLTQYGFKLKKQKGFGRKREMLTAIFTAENQVHARTQSINIKHEKPWFNIAPTPCNSNRVPKIAIIGAGIAGCALAYTLALDHFAVDLYESGRQLANKASGAAAGIFHPQLTSDLNLTSQFSWQAYLCLANFLKELSDEEKERLNFSKGLVRHLTNKESANEVLALAKQFHLTDWIKSHTSSSKAMASLYYPHAGALNMVELCHYYIEQAKPMGLSILTEQTVHALSADEFGWQVTSSQQVAHYDHVIYCGGANSEIIHQFNQLPTNTTRGQTCELDNANLAQSLKQSHCEQIYLVPRESKRVLIGTTFEKSNKQDLQPASQVEMLNRASTLMQRLELEELTKEQIHQSPLAGSVGFRLHSKDRLPMVGAAFDAERLTKDFKSFGQKRLIRKDLGQYNRTGLWLNTAYGSHGLNFSLLCAKHLSASIKNSYSPISKPISDAINPARYFIRALK